MPSRRRHRALFLATVLGVSLTVLVAACSTTQPEGGISVLTARGDINPVMANYLEGGIAEASAGGARAVLIELDTPGGLDSAMRDIVQAIDNSPVPVITYVAPSGARAASAGTFITMAGHVPAMAPNTAIGAAHPVGLGGENIDSTLNQKVENDAVAYIRGIAELRGRNADWAEQAVRQSVSITENEAVQLHVVDLVAPSVGDLLHDVDGRTVHLNSGQTIVLETADAVIHEHPMGAFDQFLLAISDPNIAFLLIAIGTIALVIDLFHGTLVLSFVGAVSLIVGLLSLGTLPINWAGVALIVLAVAFLLGELLIGSYGLLGLGGLITLAAGGLLLTGTSSSGPHVAPWLAVIVPAAVGVTLGGVTLFALRTRRRAIAVGAEGLIGMRGRTRSALAPDGYVVVHGERWHARAAQPVAEGAAVIVTGREGLQLTVEAVRENGERASDSESGE